MTRLLDVGTAGYLLRAMAAAFLACALYLQVSTQPMLASGQARAGLAILALAGVLVWLRPRSAAWLLVPAAAGLAWARAGPPPAAVPASLLRAQPRAVVVEAKVRWSTQGAPGGCSFEVDQLSGLHPEVRVWVRSSMPFPPPTGARVQLQARTRLQGGRLAFEHAVWRQVDGKFSPPSPLQRLRSWIRTRLQANLSSGDAGLARALLLGESQAAPWLQRTAYRQLGLLHLLCISGLHFWVWGGLLRRLLPGRCGALRWPCLIALAGLAQFSAPVLRAATALALREWMAARGRACLAWQLWACALWIELTRSDGLPMGLLLSYAATAGLLWAPSGFQQHGLLRALLPSAAAFLATAPLLHSWQATIEVWSIPLTPVFALLLPFRLIGCLLSCAPFCAGLGSLVFSGTRFIEQGCLNVFASMPGTPWPLPQVPSLSILWACCGCLLCMRLRSRLAGFAAALLGLSFVLAWCNPSNSHPPARLVLSDPPARWLIATGPSGSVLMPLDKDQLASPRRLDRSLLPALAKARARPPWKILGASSQQVVQLDRFLPGIQRAFDWQMHAALGFQYRSWCAAIGSEALAWQFSCEAQRLLVLVDTQPSSLRTLVQMLPPQQWTTLVLPGTTPSHPEFSIFHAQLGRPPIIGLNSALEDEP